MAGKVQDATASLVEVAFVDQGYPGGTTAEAAAEDGIELKVVKQTKAERGFVLLSSRWAVERTFVRVGRLRLLAREFERHSQTLEGWLWFAAIGLPLAKARDKSA